MLKDTSSWSVEQLLRFDFSPEHFIPTAADQSNRIESQPIPWNALLASEATPETHVSVLWDAVRLAEARGAVTIERLCSWQSAIIREQMVYGFQHVEDSWIGRLRSGNLEVSVGRHMGTRAYRVLDELAELLKDIEASLSDAGPMQDRLRLVAQFHLRYERIHPFVDGNGRTGRALALSIARRLGIPPVLFTHCDRYASYYPAFGDEKGDAMFAYCQRHQFKKDCFAI